MPDNVAVVAVVAAVAGEDGSSVDTVEAGRDLRRGSEDGGEDLIGLRQVLDLMLIRKRSCNHLK